MSSSYVSEKKLKNKAFTLIELLAVIVILAIIALIATPSVLNIIEDSRKSSFLRSIDGIVRAVKIDQGSDKFSVPREYFYDKSNLLLLTVKNEKKDKIVDTNGKFEGNGFIHVDEYGNVIIDNLCNEKYCASGTINNIKVTPNEDGTLTDFNKNDPTISLIGDSIVYVEQNYTYEELGASAKTQIGDELEFTIAEIKLNGELVSSVDTSVLGTYVIKYSATSNEKTVSVERIVYVLDMTPNITFTEPSEKYVSRQEITLNVKPIVTNNITSFTYEIKKDGFSIIKETITGTSKTITLDSTGIYEVIVNVVDNNSHSNTLSKTYKIDTTKPTQTFGVDTSTIGTDNWYQALNIKVTGTDAHSGPKTIKYCTTTGSSCTPDKIYSSSIVLSSNSETQKVCAQTIDDVGNTGDVTCSEAYKVDTTAPTQNFTINSSTLGNNGWYTALSIKVTGIDAHSGAGAIKYCVTTGTTCTPETTYSSAVSLSSNASAQRICANVINGAGITSATTCSDAYNVDSTIPTLSLSKITSVEWAGQKTIASNGTSSGYYDVNGEPYWVEFDYMATSASSNCAAGEGAYFVIFNYYNENKTRVASSNGYKQNGSTNCAPLNTWAHDTFDGYQGFGTKYVLFGISNQQPYASNNFYVKNFTVWGQLPNSFYYIDVAANDNLAYTVKYASGSQTVAYFKDGSGTAVTGTRIKVTSNGTYTVFIQDTAGNAQVQTIQITRIS